MNVQKMATRINQTICRFECGEGVSIVPTGRYVLFEKYAELECLFNTATDWAEELATEKQRLQQQLAAAREALQAAEADAARYRCLRDSDFGTLYYRDENCDLRTHYPSSKSACESLDAAIDATLQRDRQP